MSRGLILLVLLFSAQVGQAQTVADSTRYHDEVRSLVGFFEYMLNSIGSAKTPTRDKEVIITQSYKKIFSSAEVQIEDDLILDRKVITNKDVSAYLRDVDFFFKEIRFSFENIEIRKMEKGDDSFYFLVSFENSVNGTTIDDENHSSIKERFLEINLNEETGDLKIASVYSTKVSREKELQLWWESLSYAWIREFKKYVPFDSISDQALLQIASIDSLDLSGNQFILDLEPLAALRNLTVLDISHIKISEIKPLRYAKNLGKLVATSTPISDITSLQYFEKLTHLDLSQTELLDISILERLRKLEYLDLSHTSVFMFEPIQHLSSLVEINLSGTAFSDPTLLSGNVSLEKVDLSRTSIGELEPFKGLKEVWQLDVSETGIGDINSLEGHPALEVLFINRTSVNDLEPLINNHNLKKVYADFTGITAQMASAFMAKKINTVVVTNSERIMEWWKNLPANWRIIFTQLLGKENPEKEDIVKLMNLDSLDLSHKKLYEPGPLKQFQRLRYLDLSGNLFTDFTFTENMDDLQILKGSDLPVESTKGLEKNTKLKVLVLERSLMKDIQALVYLNKLEAINVNDTQVDEGQIVSYLKSNPKTVVIYQSEELLNWWGNLSPEWKNAFGPMNPDAHQLHELIQRKEVSISNQRISSLASLNVFINLEKIVLDKINVINMDQLYKEHKGLSNVSCTNTPLQTIAGIQQLKDLKSLNISNTAVDDLKELSGLTSLENLNCAGTGIKNLKGISGLHSLESLDISNTRIWKLVRLSEMKNLKTLVCYNTRLRPHEIEEFKAQFPECEVTYY